MNFSESLALKTVSLLLALILWITILGFKKEELRKNVKFQPLVAPGMMITSKIPAYIQFTLRGPRVQLNDVEKRTQPIRPDLRRTKEATIPIGISEDLIGELPLGVKVVNYHPSNVLLRMEKVQERYVVVQPTLQGLPAEGYDIAQMRVVPSKVLVSGPESLLRTLPSVGTEVIDTRNLRGNKKVQVEVQVDLEDGYRLTGESFVSVEIVVSKSKPKN